MARAFRPKILALALWSKLPDLSSRADVFRSWLFRPGPLVQVVLPRMRKLQRGDWIDGRNYSQTDRWINILRILQDIGLHNLEKN